MKYVNVIILLFALLIPCAFSSCLDELDNYPAPNGTIYGMIVDSGTNQPVPLPVPGANGIIIKMTEQRTGATKPQEFYAHQDGTFLNKLVFNGDYLITVNGPFVETAEVNTKIKGKTKIVIPVIPYTRIQSSTSISDKIIKIQYHIQKTDPSYHISGIYGYWNFSPNVDASKANYAGKVEIDGNELEGTISINLNDSQEFVNNLYKIEANGNKIYVRVGAETKSQINYSPISVVIIP